MRILVVDDNYVNRLQIRSLMGQYGDCDGASTGTLGIDMFKAAHQEGVPYGLITMDVSLPDIDGREVVKQIRAWEDDHRSFINDREAKILMISSSDKRETIFESFRKGVEGYLVKPVTDEKLRVALYELELVIG